MPTNVLIVGAGPTGLALALLLLRSGLSVRIIEKQLQFHPGERGAGIQPRTLELYKFLGLLPDIIERSATSPRNLKYYTAPDNGKPPRLAPMVQLMDDTPDRPMVSTFMISHLIMPLVFYDSNFQMNARMLGQNRHEKVLREHILAYHGVHVEFGTELRSFEQTSDHVLARVVKTVDSKAVEENVTVNWLVGADGARSVVRKQLGLSFLGESPEMEVVTGDIHVLGDSIKQEHPDGWTVWAQSDNVIVALLRPCLVRGKNLFQFLIRGGNEKLDMVKISSSREEMVKAFHHLTGRRDIEFGELVWIGLWRPNIRMVNRFGKGRVFVAGDAAHIHSPTGGQGMNSGVQDCFNLAWKLALVQKGLAPQSLLDSYSNERTPVIASMLNKTTELFKKEFVAKVGQRQDIFRGYELRQLGVNYRGTHIIFDEKYTDNKEIVDSYRSGDDGTIRAGDRAPDAPSLSLLGASKTIKTMSFFDIFKTTQHTVLIFPGSAGHDFVTGVLNTLREYNSDILKSIVVLPRASDSISSSALADMTLVDTEGYAYLIYAITDDTPTVFIVRPDGYIGALITSGESGVRSYFSSIFV
ncbi:monooxygenase [Lentinula aciculospora]|uniref:Monooxygenase n=1 Tax=Lentinula aciculospora TaxID=153920 RepID=A0A9W9A6U4_9AGAR|nr:monooxygenase [Lentinula aciculospora]